MDENVRYLEENEIKGKKCDNDHPFIFISYAHNDDTAVIRKVFSELYDSGFNLWIDVANLPVNADGWEKAAQEALRSPNCKLLVYFRSHVSLKKNTIKRELESFISCQDRNSDNIITVDLSSKNDLHTTEYLTLLKQRAETAEASAYDKGEYANCKAICDIVSTHCNALRYRIDFKNINEFIGTLIREMNEHGFQQTFSLQEKIEFILDGSFHIVLNPAQDRVMRHYQALLRECMADPTTKRTLIINGKPGVGKSVLAMSMLNEYIRLIKEQGKESEIDTSQYDLGFLVISKNNAPRDAYKGILNLRREANKPQKEYYTRLLNRADKVFKGSVGLIGKYSASNCVKIIVTDEAHRLVAHNRFDKGYSQTDVIVNAAQLSIFFVDEDQMVSYEDYGTKENIKASCEKLKSRCFVENLRTQMRCGGADSYMDWVDCLMEKSDNDKPSTVGKCNEYDLKVFDSPSEMHEAIVKKNSEDGPARTAAGICWYWPDAGKNDDNVKDVVIGDFKKSWNLEYKGKKINFASDPDSVDQIGCIHTVQGLEFTYAGVIIGEDMDYDPVKKRLVINDDVAQEYSYVLKGCGVMEKQGEKLTKEAKKASTPQEYHEKMKEAAAVIEECERKKSSIIRNIYRVLLTRGTKGCYIFCVNPNLQEYVKEQVKLYNESFYRF